MDFVTRTLRLQRFLVGALLIGSAVAFWRATYDVFNTVKATVIVVGTLGLLVVSAVRVSRTRRVVWPATPAWYPVGLFIAGLVAATAAASSTPTAVVGRPGRHTGLALYFTYTLVFLAVVRLYRDASPAQLARAVLFAAVPVTGYGLLQAAGVEPLSWQAVEGGPQVFATFGNANFFAAWLGIAVPLCVWGALSGTWSTVARAGAVLLAAGAFAAAYASRSLQGPAAALAGVTVVAACALLDGARKKRRGLWLLAGVGLAGLGLAGVAVALVARAGPFAMIGSAAEASLGSRLGKWEAALAMWADRPLLGVGLDGYADWYHRYRTAETAVQGGLARTADTPHNVVLDMLAGGGLVLAVGYVAFVGFTGWALIQGLRRLVGEERLLLAGLGGAWVAYQVQALVSIDVPPLAVLHWVLAGAIVALATRPPLRQWALPGAPPVARPRPGARKRRAQAPPQPLVRANPVLLAGIAVAALVGLWVALIPVRADMAAADAANAAAAGRVEEALTAYQRAARFAPWESRYPAQHAAYLAKLGRPAEALARHEEAARRDPEALAHSVNIGRLAVQLGDEGKADRAYVRALELDPTTPEVLVEVGQHWLRRGDLAAASALLERAVSARDDNAAWWVALGAARSADGDVPGAREAYQRALDLDPASAAAAEALARLA